MKGQLARTRTTTRVTRRKRVRAKIRGPSPQTWRRLINVMAEKSQWLENPKPSKHRLCCIVRSTRYGHFPPSSASFTQRLEWYVDTSTSSRLIMVDNVSHQLLGLDSYAQQRALEPIDRLRFHRAKSNQLPEQHNDSSTCSHCHILGSIKKERGNSNRPGLPAHHLRVAN